jgi:hypothetical protein
MKNVKAYGPISTTIDASESEILVDAAIEKMRNMPYKNFVLKVMRIHYCDMRCAFVAVAEPCGVAQDKV